MAPLANHRHAEAVSPIRRSLLLSAPAVGALVSLPAAALGAGGNTEHAVGIMLPASERVIGARAEWLAGFMREQKALGGAMVRETAFASGPRAIEKATRRLLDAGCTTLVGWTDANAVAHLMPQLDRRGARFVVSDFGAKSLRVALPEGVERCGAELWRTAHSAGVHLAHDGARTALVASSFYESGFDLVGAFEQGFHSAGGMRIEVVVTGTPDLAHGEQAWNRIDHLHAGFQPDATFALYSGADATEFLQLLDSSHAPRRLRGRPVMVLSPMLQMRQPPMALATSTQPLQMMQSRWSGAVAGESLYSQLGRAAARRALRDERPQWYSSLHRGTVGTLLAGAADNHEQRVASTCADCLYTDRTPTGWLLPYGA